MTYYFAVFIPVNEGGYGVMFPDFPETLSQGDDLAECMSMAADALSLTVEEYAKARRALPAPSTLEQAQAFARREMAAGPGVDAARAPLCQLIAAPEVDMTPVRVTISLAKSVLESIDEQARQAGLTRSAFIARAAQSYAV